MEFDKRPWGFYEVLCSESDYKVKRITVYPGQRLSLQRHKKRSEHWFVVKGNGLVTVNGKEITVGPGSSVDIPCGALHRIANTGTEDLVFVEVQRGYYLGEDDVERIEDDYGRI